MTGGSLLGQAKLITNWRDQDLAAIIGDSRSKVQMVVTGRIPEVLDLAQRKLLIDAVRQFVADGNDLFAEMELFS